MSEETVSESQFSLKTAVLRVFDLPLSWYYSLSQIKFSPVAKKLFVVTAVSAVSVIFLAHHFKRRRGKKKGKILPWEPEHLVLEYTKRAASDKGSSCSSSRQNLTLSLSSAKDKGSQSCNYANGGLFSKYSGSAQSLASDIISTEFIHKLEALLQRAYRLQEEFEATLGASDSNSLVNDIDKDTDTTMKGNMDEFGLRDSLSVASTDSFASATELAEHREGRHAYSLESLCHCPFYEEAMHLVEEGKIYSRVLRTEMLECLGDSDFLAKLHCIRQAFQVILSETANRIFLAESGRKILSALIVKARKNPKKFEDVFDEMIYFLEQTDHWDSTEMELAARGVKNLNFYDVVLDFILMDSFEDLENPPTSIQNVVNNRWLNSSFKETAVASSCWSVLKQKRQQMKIPDGFFAHFYAICEQISPVLAWGFLGPRNSLYDLCCFFKNQVLFFLKDIFDFEKVRYSSIETLAEDLMQLLIRRTELLTAYLGADALRHTSSCLSSHGHVMSSGLLEAKVQ
ncbi:mitoguardin 1 [Leptonychotes weddellii]|uniref:Mitoguardin 1 n=1 Tax=Leptonychotes weddellii TaxID=9713 RepID=A0A7F8QRZ6_LEPWE|nr:mitoguardin 1 [Leptonychotes weddellii]